MNEHKFIEKVKKSLCSASLDFENLHKEKKSVGLGISGGADSVSLFLALEEILSAENIPLVCVTVNHHIREKSETDGDVEFVKNLIEIKKNNLISLRIFDIPEGHISKIAAEKKCGVEAAARIVRYECFEKAIEENNISFFCLAHNQDDNLETILMRFLQGSPQGGILPKRDKFIRPLLDISRAEIENFLHQKNQDFKTDSTNFSDSYLRNNIRINLVPVLNEKFDGWKTALLHGDEKKLIDEKFLENAANEIFHKFIICKDEIKIPEKIFLQCCVQGEGKTVFFRAFIQALNFVGVSDRIPFSFFQSISSEIEFAIKNKKRFSKIFSVSEIELGDEFIFVKRLKKKQSDFGFFDIIEKEGCYEFPFGKIEVKRKNDNCIEIFCDGKTVTYSTDFPFVIRSLQLGEHNKKDKFIVE